MSQKAWLHDESEGTVAWMGDAEFHIARAREILNEHPEEVDAVKEQLAEARIRFREGKVAKKEENSGAFGYNQDLEDRWSQQTHSRLIARKERLGGGEQIEKQRDTDQGKTRGQAKLLPEEEQQREAEKSRATIARVEEDNGDGWFKEHFKEHLQCARRFCDRHRLDLGFL
jgi:hypothetical protein